MGKFTLINQDRSRIKIFETFEGSSKNSSIINAILISYGCVYKKSNKPIMKSSRVESIEEARKEFKRCWMKDGRKHIDSIVFFPKC